MNKIFFSKLREDAIIPTKIDENAGYDIYACFDEDYMVIKPLETVLIPTGIATAFDNKFYAQIQERGSTGSKGIKYSAGVIDSGYRGEWFIAITNCNDIDVIIGKKGCCDRFPEHYRYIHYPYEKGIAQFVMLPVPEFETEEIEYEKLLEFKSERGVGKIGSSNK